MVDGGESAIVGGCVWGWGVAAILELGVGFGFEAAGGGGGGLVGGSGAIAGGAIIAGVAAGGWAAVIPCGGGWVPWGVIGGIAVPRWSCHGVSGRVIGGVAPAAEGPQAAGVCGCGVEEEAGEGEEDGGCGLHGLGFLGAENGLIAHLFQTAESDYPGISREVKSKLGVATAGFRKSQFHACIAQALPINFRFVGGPLICRERLLRLRCSIGGTEDDWADLNRLVANWTEMFTGLVEGRGRITDIWPMTAGLRLRVVPESECAGVSEAGIGDSISISGCCLTVVSRGGGGLEFEAGLETLSKTHLGRLRSGSLVNLERSLRADARLGGHFVQGHVDGVARVGAIDRDGDWVVMWFHPEAAQLRLLVSKGSVAVDGVSLTVAGLERDRFSVALIPHTLSVTTLGSLVTGDLVNLENDILGKYVDHLLQGRLSGMADR